MLQPLLLGAAFGKLLVDILARRFATSLRIQWIGLRSNLAEVTG